jgi:hypothetical protein
MAIARWQHAHGVTTHIDRTSAEWLAGLPDLVGDGVVHLVRVLTGASHDEKRAVSFVFNELAEHPSMVDAVRAAARAVDSLNVLIDMAARGAPWDDTDEPT